MENTVTIAFDLPRPLAMGLVTLLGVTLASWLVYLTLPEAKTEKGALHRVRASLGLGRMHPVVMLVGMTLYIALVGILLLGLFGLIIATLQATGRTNDYLFYVLRIGGLTAVLGAVVAFPFTLIRLGLSQESLFNDKINEATKGLYARRQITVGEGADAKDHWQDDIVQRNAAIDRLEGLAQEKPTEVPRIARLLSVYVRELSAEVPAQAPPKEADPRALKAWVRALPKLRSDMEKAAQTLGRLADIAPDPLVNGEIDLRGANLQAADLRDAKFDKALLQGTQLQGAILIGAQLQGAILFKAQLQGAILIEAQLQGADLSEAQLQAADLGRAQLQGAILIEAQLQGADLGGAQLQAADLFEAQLQGAILIGAQLQGADLSEAQFDDATSFTAAIAQAAAVKEVDLTNVSLSPDQITSMFSDGSATLPGGITPDHPDWPPHWPQQRLGLSDFHTRWTAFKAKQPPGWDAPQP